MSMRPLEPGVRHNRDPDRVAGRIALGALLLVVLAAATVDWSGVRACGRPMTLVHVPVLRPLIVPMPVPVPISAPPAVVPPAAARHACPAPVRRAARVAVPRLPEAITHVRPSATDARWILAWNATAIFVSVDAGRSWRRVLDAPGAVLDAGFDCFGHALALRGTVPGKPDGGALGVLDGAAERWHAVPDLTMAPDASMVVGGGPDVVILARPTGITPTGARLAVSDNLGASWRTIDLEPPIVRVLTPGQARQVADGTITAGLVIGDCRSDSLAAFTVRGTQVVETQYSVGEQPLVLSSEGVIADGWWEAAPSRVDDMTYPERVTGLAGSNGSTAIPAPWPALVYGDTAYRVRAGHARPLPLVVDGTPQAIDPAGRLWMIVCGQPRLAGRTASGNDTCDAAMPPSATSAGAR